MKYKNLLPRTLKDKIDGRAGKDFCYLHTATLGHPNFSNGWAWKCNDQIVILDCKTYNNDLIEAITLSTSTLPAVLVLGTQVCNIRCFHILGVALLLSDVQLTIGDWKFSFFVGW